MLQVTFIEFFERDLKKLIDEINQYSDETQLWTVKEGIRNSAGNLSLHLVGNLDHFIGTTLGDTGYIRKRDDEFTLKNIPRVDLVKSIENTIKVVKNSLDRLTAAELEKDFPLEKHGRTVSTMHMLMHLLAHLAYHLGQVNYHRRLTGR